MSAREKRTISVYRTVAFHVEVDEEPWLQDSRAEQVVDEFAEKMSGTTFHTRAGDVTVHAIYKQESTGVD